MKKYRLLTQEGYPTFKFMAGNIYPENWKYDDNCFTIAEQVQLYPNDWELVEDDFVLPEKWYVAVTNENLPIISKWLGKHNFNLGNWSCVHYNKDVCDIENVSKEYSEITFEQFKTHVLNMKEEKEIIGYKLIKEEFLYALTLMSSGWVKKLWEPQGYNVKINSGAYDTFKQAGVLDLWFEPVYKETTPQITINGYKGEFFDWGVKFGCAEIDREDFTELWACIDGFGGGTKSNKQITSVTIGKGTLSKEQIKEIAEYYLNKEK